jgi:hypothetical protein
MKDQNAKNSDATAAQHIRSEVNSTLTLGFVCAFLQAARIIRRTEKCSSRERMWKRSLKIHEVLFTLRADLVTRDPGRIGGD